MSIIVPGGLPEVDRQGNCILTNFRNMYRLEPLMYDPDYTDKQRAIHALHLLYGRNIPQGVTDPMGELIWFYHCGKPPKGEGSGSAGSSNVGRLYDFEIDDPFIYAGFRQAYYMDLSICAGLKLHWWEFMALFVALPESTAMGNRMFYRGVDTSKMEGKQKEYYDTRKKVFALPDRRPVAKSLAEMEEARKQRVARRFAEANRQYEQQNGGE